MTHEAIILAGGKGTRLKEAVSDRPKPMALINGKPFLEYLISYLSSFGINRIILSTGHMHQLIEEHFGSGYKNTEIVYAPEETPLGTGGGIVNALQKCTGEQVLILNGDSFFQLDLNAFIRFHEEENADLSIALKPMTNFDRYGTVTLDGDRITAFHEKRMCRKGLINTGIYLLRKAALPGLNLPEKFSFEKDFMEPFTNQLVFKGFKTDGYFLDIGLPETYQQAQEDFKVLFPGK